MKASVNYISTISLEIQFIADNVAEYMLSDRIPQVFHIVGGKETLFAVKIPAPDVVETFMGP